MWKILAKIWEWLVGAAVAVLAVLYFVLGRDSGKAYEEADKKLRKKEDEVKNKEQEVKKEKEKTKEEIERSQDKVDELKKDLDNVGGENTDDPEELKDWVEDFSDKNK